MRDDHAGVRNVAGRVPGAYSNVVAPVTEAGRVPVARKEAKPVHAVAADRCVTQHAPPSGQVLLRPRGEVLARRLSENLLGAKRFPSADCATGGEVDDRDGEPKGMVRRSEPGQLFEPADERLRIAHAHPHVDTAEESIASDAGPRVRQACHARRRPPRPGGIRRCVEANLANHRSCRVDVRMQLASGTEGIDEDRMPAREDELAQVDVPIPSTRPADVLPGRH